MACVRHEIDPHLLGRDRARPVDHSNEHASAIEFPDDEAPRAARLGDPGHVQLGGDMRKDPFERLRMPNGQPNVAAFDSASKEPLRRPIGKPHDASLDDKRWLVERGDQRALTGIGSGHIALSSGLIGLSHVVQFEEPPRFKRGGCLSI